MLHRSSPTHLALLLLLFACEPPCDQAMLPALQTYSFMGTHNYSLKDVGEQPELNVVIRSQGDYDKFVVTANTLTAKAPGRGEIY